MEVSTYDGIHLLGDENGLNFEIEYENDKGEYQEAVFGVNHKLANQFLSQCSQQKTHLSFALGKHIVKIELPGQCNKLFAIRRPNTLGGEDITRHFNHD